MAFQGDATHIPLSNILQALTLNGQVGVLTVECPAFRRRIRLHQLGIRPLNFNLNPPDLLQRVLLKQKLLNESQCQNIFSTWNPKNAYPGDFLVRRRILTPDMVEADFRTQIENALLDIFIAPNIQYEFSAGEDGAEYELFDPDGLGELMLFNVNSILMEAARREDEWSRFRNEIPNDEEIFRIPDRGSLSAKKVDVPARNLAEMKAHLHGESTINRISEETTLSHFEILEVLFHLKKADLIRPLALAEKKALAEKLRRSMRHKDAASIYESVLLNDPDDTATRERLIRLYEASKNSEEHLAQHYTALACSLSESDADKALTCYGKALEAQPLNFEALEPYFAQCCTALRSRDAFAALRRARSLSESPAEAKRFRDLLVSLADQFPQEVLLLHELADAYVRERDPDTAVSYLKQAAEIYKLRNDQPRLAKCAEKIARLNPAEASSIRKLVENRQSSRPPTLRLARLAFTAALLCGSLCLLGAMGVIEWYSRMAFAEVRGQVETFNTNGDFDESRRLLLQFEESYPLSLKRLDAETLTRRTIELEATAEREAVKQQEQRRANAEALLVKAQIEASRDRYSEALKIIDSVEHDALPVERAEKLLRLRTELLAYFHQAEDLHRQAQAARSAQNIAKSHELTKQLITRFPRAPIARTVRLPIRIVTNPPGAQLQVDGKMVGETPGVFDFPPTAPESVVVAKKGYSGVNLSRMLIEGKAFDPLTFSQLIVDLRKAIEWTFKANASVECVPSTLGRHVFVASRSGTVSCLDHTNGSLVWSYETPSNMDVAGGIGIWNSTVYFGCFDGRVYAVRAANGELLHEGALASKAGLPIKAAPSQASPEGLVALNCGGASLSGYDLKTGKITWSRPFSKSRLLGRPLALLNSGYAVTSTGDILEVALESGEIQRHTNVSLAPQHQTATDAGHILLASKEGEVAAFDVSNWKTLWRYRAGAMLSGPPTADSAFVMLPLVSGHIVCLTSSGKLKWRRESPFAIASQGVLFRNTYFVGTMTGQVLAVGTWNGKTRWTFATDTIPGHQPKAFLTAGVVNEGKLFIGSEDHQLYCFTIE